MHTADNGWNERAETARRFIDELVDTLPEDVRHHAEDLALELEDTPAPALHQKGFPAVLLGLFSGRPLRAPMGNSLHEPTVTLYLDNLWRISGHDWDRFEEEVRKTYLHELGHFLGLNEADLAARKLS